MKDFLLTRLKMNFSTDREFKIQITKNDKIGKSSKSDKNDKSTKLKRLK